MASEPKDGNTQLAEAAEEPTLDEYLRRSPDTLTDDDLRRMVTIERGNRARYIAKVAERKDARRADPEGKPAQAAEEDSDAD